MGTSFDDYKKRYTEEYIPPDPKKPRSSGYPCVKEDNPEPENKDLKNLKD